MKKQIISEILVFLAGISWGLMSVASRPLSEMGFSSIQINFLRMFFSALIMGVIILIKDKNLFKIKSFKDLLIFMGSGILSLLFFGVCYTYSIEYNSVSVAAMLLYTSPLFIIVFSLLIFKEKVTLVKIISLFGVLGGSVLLMFNSSVKISGIGILFGLGSAFGYALYSIFGKLAEKRGYKAQTIIFYAFLFSSIGSLPFCKVWELPSMISADVNSLIYIAILVVLVTALPYNLYTLGLMNISAGKAGIIATVELVSASIYGLIFFGENIYVFGILGIILVFASLIFAEIMRDKPLLKKRK